MSEHNPPMTPWAFATLARKALRREKLCLAAQLGGCSGDIVRAHVVAEAGLRSIARANHVMRFDTDSATLATTGRVQVVPVGVNEASTFTGFCQRHDDSLFAPIEKRPFRV